jgi:hypothetical protein
MEKFLLFKKLLLLLLFSISFYGFTQVNQEWVARYNGPGNGFDLARSLAVDKQGNTYVTGGSAGAGTGLDYSTIKYNAAGVKLWEARYNNVANQDDEAFSIAVDHQGNVYVTGRSVGGETGYDFATIKYNSSGVMQWVARYAGTGPATSFDGARSIKVDNEGNVYVTGESVGNLTSFDYVTVKYDPNGSLLWEARYDGPGQDDFPNALALDDAGNVYVTGRSAAGEDPEGQDADYTTIKYNTNGNELWVSRYDGPIAGNRADIAQAITVDQSENVYVTGRSAVGDPDAGGLDYATVKYDANGNEQWVATYNGPGNSTDRAVFVAVDSAQNVYVTGASDGEPDEANADYATIRYDANGNELWVSRYNGPADGHDQATLLALDSVGNVYVTGISTGIGTGNDFATLKYNAAGVEQWVARYNGPANGDDGPGPVAVDGLGNVYVTGFSTGIGTDFDYTTIKYSQPRFACGKNNDKVLICHKGKKTLCINEEDMAAHIAHGDHVGECPEDDAVSVGSGRTEFAVLAGELPAGFRIFNTPNPVSSITKIYYELPFDGHVSLKLYDMMGREIKTLVNGARKAGHYSENFDASVLQNGMYNYRITVKTKTKVWVHTNKLSIVK